MKLRAGIRVLALAAAALLLAGCTGLPTSGPPQAGLPIGGDIELPDFTPIARDPEPGAGPEAIVAGFLEASMTPANNWEIARKFLTEDFSHDWDPDVGVAIDSSVLDRDFDPSVDADDEKATRAEVKVQLDQIAGVSAEGEYSAGVGTAKATYRLARDPGGEWRISEAKDGITLDIDTFSKVYEKFSLKYFDKTWTHLVPDVRWFPRGTAMATTVARALVSGVPSDWLAPAVQTAFPADVSLVGDAVPIDPAQVASVSLTRTALSTSSTVLARMRTQLEASLAGAGVAEVQFVVDGSPLPADTVAIEPVIVDPGVLVYDGATFGTASAGEITPVPGLTQQIAKISTPIRSIDMSLDARLAAVQLTDGHVWAVSDGAGDQVDGRAGLITPSLDPFGYIWSVPSGEPAQIKAWTPAVVGHQIADAWPEADAISHVRVSADGARVAAIVTSGGQHLLVVAAIIRDDEGLPTALGQETPEIAVLDGPARGLSWVGSDSVAVLSADPDPTLTTYVIGGPWSASPAPTDATALAGARTSTGLRVLSADGAVYAQRGSSWQKAVDDVVVLGTRAGY
ncbi:LpqB family beta-propeller domain-containing protein [Microbacterium sp. H1-D42]|uniref:LpqB family beta-propeller domain-containing protein n=1 Tax=Microbacterium sp. H1-D42 TaxID=2925844 RepID=UPI001F53AC9F|nr:LpqB family beta-propeller domain-containing protein [Microbacterium sp. H1-D42]UNK69690.1 LpqB family beta-propeller domain-containing protein [Microbacterium sp. H1-D42]